MASVFAGEDIEISPLEGKINEIVEDQEPSSIPEIQETSFQPEVIPAEVIGQDRENFWIYARFREYYNQLIKILKRPDENFIVNCTKSYSRFMIKRKSLHSKP